MPQRLLCVLSLILVFAAGQPVRAAEAADPQSQSALAVSPAIIEEVLAPGRSTPFTLLVNNVTNFPLPVKGFVRNLTPDAAQEVTGPDAERLDASRWVTINEPDFILQPKQVRTVKGIINPPADASPGGHYATIFFQPLVPQEALSQATAYMNARVGVLAFFVVKGDIVQKAVLGNTLATAGLIRHGPAEFSFSLHNQGNVHLLPSGRLLVRDWQGREVGGKEVPIGVVLPNTTKDYAITWDPPGWGKYRAELVLSYGAEGAKLPPMIVEFWVVPWIEIMVGAVGIALGMLFVVRTHRRWKKAWRVLRGKPGKI